MADPLVRAIDELTNAVRRLGDQPPEVEVELPPPICPNCRQLNPRIFLSGNEENGPLGEFVLYGVCGNCKQGIYGVPLAWAMFKDRQEAIIGAKENLERIVNGSTRNA